MAPHASKKSATQSREPQNRSRPDPPNIRSGGATLEDLRKRIDEINLKLVTLFNQRARLAQQIGQLKHADGAPIYQPVRERQVLDRVVAHNRGRSAGTICGGFSRR